MSLPIVALGLVAAFFIGGALIHIFWYIRPDKIETFDDLQSRINGGQPVIVEVFSNL